MALTLSTPVWGGIIYFHVINIISRNANLQRLLYMPVMSDLYIFRKTNEPIPAALSNPLFRIF
jgi:hypothetical protein